MNNVTIRAAVVLPGLNTVEMPKTVMVMERYQRCLVKTGKVAIYRAGEVEVYVPRTKAVL